LKPQLLARQPPVSTTGVIGLMLRIFTSPFFSLAIFFARKNKNKNKNSKKELMLGGFQLPEVRKK
jgi:hypothetical protein